MSKKRIWLSVLLTIIFMAAMFVSVFWTINKLNKKNVQYLYALNDQGAWVDEEQGEIYAGTDQPYIAVLNAGCPEEILSLSMIPTTPLEYGSASIYVKDKVLYYVGTGEQEILICTDATQEEIVGLEIQGNGDTFHHYGDIETVRLGDMEYGPYYEHGHTEQCFLKDGRIILEKYQNLETVTLSTQETGYSYSKAILQRIKGEPLPKLNCQDLQIEAGKTKALCKVEDIVEEVTTSSPTEEDGEAYEIIQQFVDAKGIVMVEAQEDPTLEGGVLVSGYIQLEEPVEGQENEKVSFSYLP